MLLICSDDACNFVIGFNSKKPTSLYDHFREIVECTESVTLNCKIIN